MNPEGCAVTGMTQAATDQPGTPITDRFTLRDHDRRFQLAATPRAI